MDFVKAQYQMCDLVTAAEAKAVADEAPFVLEKQSVAYAINSAANTGAHEVTWSKPLSPEMIDLLKENGYHVIQNTRAADPETSWKITGF